MSNERVWTDNQMKAITHSGSDLIVAAAAGSGKTATLTERVIRRVVSGDCELDRLLIVTFTKAAAEELRIRIRQELTKRSLEDPENDSLKLKLLALNSAQISTIHGFCSAIIKDNYSSLGLPCGMRIAEDSEAVLLKKRIMERVIDDYYEQDVPSEYADDSFEELVDCLIKNKTTDSLCEIMISVFNKICSCARGAEIIKQTAENFYSVAENGFFKSPYGDVFKTVIEELVFHYTVRLSELISDNADDEVFFKKYYPMLCEDVGMLQSAYDLCRNDEHESALSLVCKHSFATLGRASGEYEWKETVKALRAKLKKDIDKLRIYNSFSPDLLSEIAKKGGDTFICLYKFIKYFDAEFEREKIKRRIMDYNDLERYTYRLLYDENGVSELGCSLRSTYSEIYVDEYQDCNSLQDAIFAALASENRFMVGDIKQSIYSFRGAEPDLFSDYRTKFSDPAEGGTALFLSNNFRCSKRIIDFSNLVFSSVFSQTGTVPYSKEDELVFSKLSSESEKVTVAIVEQTQELSAAQAEAEYVADTIDHLIRNGTNESGQPYRPGDFAILFRSVRKNAEIYEKALKKKGIPVYNSAEKSFFESSEILLAVCLLSAIDNPVRDIQLAGLMQSPLFGFTLDEMVKIRKGRENMPLYDSLHKYASETGCEKTSSFLKKLELYREKAQGMQTDKLVWYLFADTGIFACLDKLGEKSQIVARRSNLLTFYEFARKFEAGSFKGLYNFVNYINELIAKNTKLETVKAECDYDSGVKIMTIHKSKGLEFPVCFLCNASARLENTSRDFYKYDKEYGFCIKIRDGSGFAMYKTPMYEAVSQQQHRKTVQEEGRLLYVAMTRAKNRLYITCNAASAEKITNGTLTNGKMTPFELYSSNGYMQMILRSLNGESEGDSYIVKVINTASDIEAVQDAAEDTRNAERSDGCYDQIIKNASFVYPYKAHISLPKKVSASRLHPDMLDVDAVSASTSDIPLMFTDPRQIRLENAAAQKGIATHLFMQFCDFDLAVKNGIAEEASRLCERGFIPQSAAEDIDISAVSSFFESELYKRLCMCKKNGRMLYREYRFNINLDAELFTKCEETEKAYKGERILVQGVVDMFFEESDGSITLVDYKTDRLDDSPSCIEDFKMRHSTQLSYYKTALERITKKPVGRTVLYSFSLGREIDLDLK